MSPSLRRRGGGRPEEPPALRLPTPPGLLDVLRDGPAPLARRDVDREALDVALVVPPGDVQPTVNALVQGLEALGHRCRVGVVDGDGLGLGDWDGADVAIAAGWQTVPRALLLPGVAARVQLVEDHEPDWYGASASREWAAWTYRQDLHCVAAGEWLAARLRREYGASAGHFDLGVDHDTYRPLAIHRQENLVLFHAEALGARHAVPLGALALEELHRRRGELVQILLFGERRPLDLPFPHGTLGAIPPDELAQAYNAATVGVALELTNPSTIPGDMLACGLAVVGLACEPVLGTFGEDGPLTLAPPDPLAVCDAIETLLDDFEARALRVREGLAWAGGRSWGTAAEQVAAELVTALDHAGRP